MANRREKLETVADIIFLGSKLTEDGDYSLEIKNHSFDCADRHWQNNVSAF